MRTTPRERTTDTPSETQIVLDYRTFQSLPWADLVRALTAKFRAAHHAQEQHEGTVQAAVANYCESSDGEIQIDPYPPLAIVENGVWVNAWVWVQTEETDQ